MESAGKLSRSDKSAQTSTGRPAHREDSSEPSQQHLQLEGISGQRLTAPGLLAMQRTTGNAAATRAVAHHGVARRQPQAAGSVEDRVAALEKQQRIAAKRTAAIQQDLQWQPRINSVLSSYRQSIYRVSGAMQTAVGKYQATQAAQAQLNALVNQALVVFATVSFSALFEPAMGALGSELKWSAAKIRTVTEAVENPANAAVSSGSSAGATVSGISDANKGQVPAGNATGTGSDPLAFLTQNMETYEERYRDMQSAFSWRANEMNGLSDEQWEKYDLARSQSTYVTMEKRLLENGPRVELLKPAEQIALIIERHLWAAKFRQVVYYGQIELGTLVEQRLNENGVAADAQVRLSESFWIPNSWSDKKGLWQWAHRYNEKISSG